MGSLSGFPLEIDNKSFAQIECEPRYYLAILLKIQDRHFKRIKKALSTPSCTTANYILPTGNGCNGQSNS